MKRKAKAARGPRKRVGVAGGTNPALEAQPTPAPTEAQSGALVAIGALGKEANALAIARTLSISRSGLLEKLDALQARGLIRPVMRRIVARYELTDSGRALLETQPKEEPCDHREADGTGAARTALWQRHR